MANLWTHVGAISLALDNLMDAPPKDRQRARDKAERAVQKLICHHGLLPGKAVQIEMPIAHTGLSHYQHPLG